MRSRVSRTYVCSVSNSLSRVCPISKSFFNSSSRFCSCSSIVFVLFINFDFVPTRYREVVLTLSKYGVLECTDGFLQLGDNALLFFCHFGQYGNDLKRRNTFSIFAGQVVGHVFRDETEILPERLFVF